MAEHGLTCWHCGASLAAIPLPIGRREECPHCSSSLHVCRMCDFYEPGASKDCREPMVDEVVDKEAANFCDYFRPAAGLGPGTDQEAAAARAKLDALFGGDSSAETASDAARRKLAALLDEDEGS